MRSGRTPRLVTAGLALALCACLAGQARADKIVTTGLRLGFEASGLTPPADGGTWDPVKASQGRVFRLGTDPAFPAFGPATGNAGFHIADAFGFDGDDSAVGEYGSAQNSGWLQNLSGNPTDADASFELWLKPADLASGKQVLFETGGGGDGSSLTLHDAELRFQAKQGGNGNDDRIRKATYTLTPDEITRYVHVVGVYDRNVGPGPLNDTVSLYVNGALVGTATGDIDDWDGGDNSGLGSKQGSVGGTGSGDFFINDFGGFNGEVSIFRFYTKALSGDEVLQNYNNQTLGTATLLYDYVAAVPGDNPASQWKPVGNPSPTRNLSLSNVDLVSVASAQWPFTQAYRFDSGSDRAATGSFLAGNNTIYDGTDSNDEKTSSSFEIWLQPDLANWSDLPGKQVLAENGGGNGFGFGLQPIADGAQLIFQIQNSSGSTNKGPYAVTVDLLDATHNALLGDFMQVVGVVDPFGPSAGMRLYINGEPVASGVDFTKFWDASGDGFGLGSIGGSNMGGFGSGSQGFSPFRGDVVLFRVYDDALSDEAVRAAYYRVPEPTTLALLGVCVLGLLRRRSRR